ncbi:hypothetical protein, partial [Stenotrophomonas maltophilia]|uniref:hypothetical protein n=1 Tax=Stenotrophomonas maltophilia TaxID=40324 RepID=UPI0019548986
FGTYDAKIEVAAINFRRASSLAQLFFGRRDYVVIDVNLTNTSAFDFRSSRLAGGVFMSYHWLNARDRVVADGIRTA